MKSGSHGVGLLTQLPGLPKQTFVSLDAVQWVLSHVDGISSQQQAIDLMQVYGTFQFYYLMKRGVFYCY